MVPARAEKRKGAVPRRPFFDQKSALGRLLVAVLALALPLALPVLALERGRRAGRGGRPGRAGGGASRAGGLRAVTARADRDGAVAHVGLDGDEEGREECVFFHRIEIPPEFRLR